MLMLFLLANAFGAVNAIFCGGGGWGFNFCPNYRHFTFYTFYSIV